MQRRIAIIVVFLLLGAIVNVAVAWGFLLYGSQSNYLASHDVERWRDFARQHDLLMSSRIDSEFHLIGIGFHVTAVDYVPTLLGGIPIIGTGTFLVYTECGWPLKSLHGWVFEHREYCNCMRVESHRGYFFKPPADGCLPLQPQWAGFSVNTLIYSANVWLLFFAPFAARRMLRRSRGLCERCAYPIGISPVCTECGAAVSRRAEA